LRSAVARGERPVSCPATLGVLGVAACTCEDVGLLESAGGWRMMGAWVGAVGGAASVALARGVLWLVGGRGGGGRWGMLRESRSVARGCLRAMWDSGFLQ